MGSLVDTKPIPSIHEAPVLGSLGAVSNDRLGLARRIAQECGDVGCFHLGPYPWIVFNRGDLAQSVLVEHADDFDRGPLMRNAFRRLVGDGLFTSEGALHHRQRKLMAPAFQPRQISSYADTMVRYAERLHEGWHEGDVVDVESAMIQLTMSVIGKVLFDADVFTQADELGAAFAIGVEHVSAMASSLVPLPLEWPLPGHRRVRNAIALLRDRIKVMIDERRHSGGDRGDFLSVLLQARADDGSAMSDIQIQDEALTFFAGGHQNTASALTWAWYLLASHPDIYGTMQREVDSALQGRSPTYGDLPQLPYTLAVLKESLRLYPPGYIVGRVALHDVAIAGYPVRRGQQVLLSIYTIHRRPDAFPQPESFDPQRFMPEREATLPRYAYMPFGAGPRVCIGSHFAMMEGHLLLAALAQRVTLELVAGPAVEPKAEIALWPKTPIKMVVRRRGAADPCL